MRSAKLRRVALFPVCAICFLLPSTEAASEPDLPKEIERISQKLKVYDFDEAIKLISEMEARDNPKAHLIKALQHELGIGVEIDPDKAMEQATLAAKQEDWEAAQYLAWRAISGPDEDQNLKKAIDWRKKLVEWKESNPSPRVIPKTLLVPEKESYFPLYEAVTKWNYEKAQAKDPVAQFNMFICLFEGRGIEPDMFRAMNWLMRAANAKNGPAARWLSLCYSIGLMTKENPVLAFKYLNIAAEAGDPESQADLGKKLIRGRGVEKDTASGILWLEKAAGQNELSAVEELADIFDDGEIVPQNLAKAFALYSKAVDLGDSYSRYNVAWMTFNGWGVEKDPQQGIRLLMEASDQGNRDAGFRLAQIYLYGWNVEPDPATAKTWADKAVENGSDYAHFVLGDILLGGLLGDKDLEKAFYHFELAAREGQTDSQIKLGYMLLWGMGIERDLDESYSWYKLAAEQNNEYAKTWLLYMQGLGWGTEQKPESMVAYINSQSEEPLTGVFEESLLRALNWKPDADQSAEDDLDIEVVLEGTELEGISPDAMNKEQWELLARLVEDEREKIRNTPSEPVDPEEEAAAKAAMEAAWNMELERHIDFANQQAGQAPPKPFIQKPPPYPPIMRRLNVEDTLLLIIIVGQDGHVVDFKYAKQPLPQFKESIDYILPQWRFIPAIEDGKPVTMRVRLPIPFKIGEEPSSINHE
jgi:TPR repeat protein